MDYKLKFIRSLIILATSWY